MPTADSLAAKASAAKTAAAAKTVTKPAGSSLASVIAASDKNAPKAATPAAVAAKPTLNFSAWDAASPAAQAKYTPVTPAATPSPAKPTLNFSAWDAASTAAQSKYTPITSSTPAPTTTTTTTTTAAPAPTPTPAAAYTAPAVATPPPSPIKVATPEIILVDQEKLPIELMTNMIFESIGGQELLSLSRHDLISGSSLQFQPISNLSDIAVQNNSHNIIPMPDSSNTYFNSFPIKLDTHVIESYGDLDSTHIYLDKVNNQLVLKVTGLKSGEQIEVEILSSITTFNDTIYQRTIL